jgi:Fe2+ or Zn2+ uptake regulation protein
VLAELGLVRKVHLLDGCHSFALAERPHGHHIICQRCQQVTEFEGCDLDLTALLQRVHGQTGYEVRDHWLELFGICPQCRQAEDREIGSAGRPPENDGGGMPPQDR